MGMIRSVRERGSASVSGSRCLGGNARVGDYVRPRVDDSGSDRQVCRHLVAARPVVAHHLARLLVGLPVRGLVLPPAVEGVFAAPAPERT